MDQILPLTAAAKQLGKMHRAVAGHVCKASAKTDVKMRYFLAKADRKWTDASGISRISPSSIVDNLMQIGVIVAGLDPVPALPEPVRAQVRISDEAV